VADYEQLARRWLEELEIADKADSLPGELSRQMKQNLVIACGLFALAKVIFFDSSVDGLDPIGIRRMKDSILKRARDGARSSSARTCAPAGGGLLERVDLKMGKILDARWRKSG